jgi:nucleoid-associated protein YgaU
MTFRSIVFFCLAGGALLLAAGCERGDSLPFSAEADDPGYRQGQQLAKQGRNPEALALYLKVIAKRGESAPESHLESGLIYLQHIKDPLAAIYHFRKYLELQPNSRQAPYVKGLVDTAKREFARTLPAQPLESQAERLEMLDQIGRLQRENDQLKAELAAARGGTSLPTVTTRAPLDVAPPPVQAATVADDDNGGARPFFSMPAGSANPAAASPSGADDTAAAGDDSPVSLARETPAAALVTSPVYRPADASPQPPTRPALSKPTPPSAGGRAHTVQKGDTLFSLAQKYYGNRSRWRDIYNANRDQLPSENSLRIGMQVRIP